MGKRFRSSEDNNISVLSTYDDFKDFQVNMKNNPCEVMRTFLKGLDVLDDYFATYADDLSVSNLDKDDYYVGGIGYPSMLSMSLDELGLDGLLVDQVDVTDSGYRLVEEDDELQSDNFNSTTNTRVEHNTILIEPFNNKIVAAFTIYGDVMDISNLDPSYKFHIEMKASACALNLPFWKQSLYFALQMRQMGNFRGAFMHLFVAFDGLITTLTMDALPDNDTTTLHTRFLYVANQNNIWASSYIFGLIEGRNAIIHGSKHLLAEPGDDELLLLLLLILHLNDEKTLYLLPNEEKYFKKYPSAFVTKYTARSKRRKDEKDKKRKGGSK